MLSTLAAIADFISSMIKGVLAFFQMLSDAVVTVTSYLASLPLWLSGLVLGVFTILLVRLLIGR